MDNKLRATINLNGKSYNAITGQQLTASSHSSANIDGILKRPAHKNYSAVNSAVPVSRTKSNRSAQHYIKRPSSAKTLMRNSVKKPAKNKPLIAKVNQELTLNKPGPIKTSPMFGKIDHRLASRAKSIKLSSNISRFGSEVKNISGSVNPYRPPQQQLEPPKTQTKRKPDIFEAAIDRATSHELPPLTKKEVKALNGQAPSSRSKLFYGMLVLLLIAVGGYGLYANMPTVMVKFADMRAGFDASLPSHQPAGYSLVSVDYGPGTVKLNYRSKNHRFTLTEHASNWDSVTLVSSIIAPTHGSGYKQISVAGQTVYLYGHNQATWVSSGILYQVQGGGNLTTDQIAKLAASL